MKSELKVSTSHRKSLLPRLNDSALIACSSVEIQSLIISGAGRVSDCGLSMFLQQHKFLEELDVSYCGLLTDESILLLATSAPQLEVLNLSGCSKISDRSVLSVFRKCKQLRKVDLVACSITDESMVASFQLQFLQSFNVRSCDRITDSSFLQLKVGFRQLTHLNIASLDMVTAASVRHLVKKCPKLRSLTADGCRMTSTEYAEAVEWLPLAQHKVGCRLQPRLRSIQECNLYVLHRRAQLEKIRVLARFIRWAVRFRLDKIRLIRRQQAIRRVRLFIEHSIKRSRWRQLIHQRQIQNGDAYHLQRCIRKLMGIHFARRKVRYLRLTRNAATTIQKNFRCYRCRKWYRRTLFDRLYFYYSKIGHLTYKMLLVSAARKLHHQIVRVQSVSRMYLKYIRFKLFRRGVVLLQKRIRGFLVIRRDHKIFNFTVHQANQLLSLTFYRRLRAAYILSHNYLICKYNRGIRKIIVNALTDCAHEQSRLEVCAKAIQRVWRRVAVKFEDHRNRRIQRLKECSATCIQAAWRMHIVYFEYLVLKEIASENLHRWVRICIQRPKLILGSWVKVIQRRARHYSDLKRRVKACVMIQRRYRAHRQKPLSTVVINALHRVHASKIQRMFYAYRFRRKLASRIARKHMAAWKLTVRTSQSPYCFFTLLKRAVKAYIRANKAARKAIQTTLAIRRRMEETELKKRMAFEMEQKEFQREQELKALPYVLLLQRAYRRYRKRRSTSLERSHMLQIQDVAKQVHRNTVSNLKA